MHFRGISSIKDSTAENTFKRACLIAREYLSVTCTSGFVCTSGNRAIDLRTPLSSIPGSATGDRSIGISINRRVTI